MHALCVKEDKAVAHFVRNVGLSMRVVPRVKRFPVPEYRNVFRDFSMRRPVQRKYAAGAAHGSCISREKLSLLEFARTRREKMPGKPSLADGADTGRERSYDENRKHLQNNHHARYQ